MHISAKPLRDMEKLTYHASCHCGAVRLQFRSEPITRGCRCNCSICIRKGIAMTPGYLPAEDVDWVEGMSSLSLYQFADHDMNHYFCRRCGICPFISVAKLPPGYSGSARPGSCRVNLGCVESLDLFGLDIELIDGRSL